MVPERSCPLTSPATNHRSVIFYPTYMNLRSIRRQQTAKLPGKHGVRVIAARFSTALPADRAQKCLHGGQDILDDDVDAFRRRMNAVRLIEPRVGRDALQEKRIERHPERFCQNILPTVEEFLGTI